MLNGGHRRSRRNERGQTVVEFALLIFFFFIAFMTVIQLALICVGKHELNHLSFQTARLWSLKAEDNLNEAISSASVAYRTNRDLTPFADFTALTLNAERTTNGLNFYGWIPLFIPGAAHFITDELGTLGEPYEGIALAQAEAGSLRLGTRRAVAVRIFVPIVREPELNADPDSGILDEFGIPQCDPDGDYDSQRCYDNDGGSP